MYVLRVRVCTHACVRVCMCVYELVCDIFFFSYQPAVEYLCVHAVRDGFMDLVIGTRFVHNAW